MEKVVEVPTITFLGAAQAVTGSRHLLSVGDKKYLIDCGLFQGPRKLKDLNWASFTLSVEELDAILLTHAHIDHTGYLPRLVRAGYRGPIYATSATCALLEILLRDAAYIQEQDAAYANKVGYSRHKPAQPLYTAADAEATLKLLKEVSFNHDLSLPNLQACWHPAGHILGSASIETELEFEGQTCIAVFSGDLGRYDGVVMGPPEAITTADYIVVESTYGDRLHSDNLIEDEIADALEMVLSSRGALIIPSFAVGRTQEVLFHIRELQRQGRIPTALQIYVDSPMAGNTTHLYCKFGDEHNLNVNLLMDERTCPLLCPETNFVRDAAESKALNIKEGPLVIISASGMCTGGRILHHLKHRLPDQRNVVLFVGYQAQGTLGSKLQSGKKEVRIHGVNIPVQARIVTLDGLSAHGDSSDILRWLSGFTQSPKGVFIVHGEVEPSKALAGKIKQRFGWDSILPSLGKTYPLSSSGKEIK